MLLKEEKPNEEEVATEVTDDADWSFCADSCNANDNTFKLQVYCTYLTFTFNSKY